MAIQFRLVCVVIVVAAIMAIISPTVTGVAFKETLEKMEWETAAFEVHKMGTETWRENDQIRAGKRTERLHGIHC